MYQYTYVHEEQKGKSGLRAEHQIKYYYMKHETEYYNHQRLLRAYSE